MLTTDKLLAELSRPFEQAGSESPINLANAELKDLLAKHGFHASANIKLQSVEPFINLVTEQTENSNDKDQITAYRALFSTIAKACIDSEALAMPGKLTGYSSAEVTMIQDSIRGEFQLTKEQVKAAWDDLVTSFPDAKYIMELLPLYFQSRDSYQKAYWDPRVEKFHIYPFFPQVIAVGLDDLKIEGKGRNRSAFKFSKDGEEFYIKTFQTESEGQIAKIAEALEIGPRQLPSLNRYLTEVGEKGSLFHRLPSEMTTEVCMLEIGKNLGAAIRKLHEAGVAFNDTIVLDDYGHSHLIVNPDCSIKLIDYGNALVLAEAYNPSNEFLRNYAKSKFGLSVMLGGEGDPTQAIKSALYSGMRDGLKHFIDYDTQLVREGLHFARSNTRISHHALNKFHQGYETALSR